MSRETNNYNEMNNDGKMPAGASSSQPARGHAVYCRAAHRQGAADDE
jgi:hypothetical protein